MVGMEGNIIHFIYAGLSSVIISVTFAIVKKIFGRTGASDLIEGDE